MEIYRENATLGVNKLDLFIASGVKQKNIEDQIELEKFLKLDKITPMQTSYTQTAEDREDAGDNNKSTNTSDSTIEEVTRVERQSESENEPSQSDQED